MTNATNPNFELSDNLRFRMKTWEGTRTWKMHVNDLYHFLGLPPKAKLPEHGFGPIMVGNTKVWIRSSYSRAAHEGNRSHRVMCECPTCFAEVPASRLHQHHGSKKCEHSRMMNAAR